MVSMRLMRLGSKERPYYRIVVVDKRAPRESKTIEDVGYYKPVESKDQVLIEKERVEYWIKKGAVPTDTVKRLLNKNGIQIIRK